MTVTVHLPNDFVQHEDPAREALEALAIEAFRTGGLSHHDAAALLKLGRLAFDDLLKQRGVTEHLYSVEDLLEDIRTVDDLRRTGATSG